MDKEQATKYAYDSTVLDAAGRTPFHNYINLSYINHNILLSDYQLGTPGVKRRKANKQGLRSKHSPKTATLGC
jgi:hypothetical protein